MPWPFFDAFRTDSVFAWRQLRKNPVTSVAALLSLALAIGACTAAFRLIDATLLRPLPVRDPGNLYSLARNTIGSDGKPRSYEDCEYPLFQQMRAAIGSDAELLAIAGPRRFDLTYASYHDMEPAQVQYVSGSMFESFGLTPAAGRLLSERDDLTPGAHPYAVLSHDYWARRFNRDPRAIGRTFRMDGFVYEIVGVASERFTGTETGTVTDVFVPTMMRMPAVMRDDSSWFRTWVRLRPGGVESGPLRDRLQVVLRAFQEKRAAGFVGFSKQRLERFIGERLTLEPASAGVSALQRNNRPALLALAVLVGFVLLIACANVANLMTAQAASRAREMAVRISIGASRSRLVRLVLIESVWMAIAASLLGALFAWWAAPFVVSLINPPDNPARLYLPFDWRVSAFGLALALLVTCLFGLAPALRASSVKPVDALKGGADPHASRRVMHALIAAQVAFCVFVLFAAGLFVGTFDRLVRQPMGFSAEGVLALTTVAESRQPQELWRQVAEHLRGVPGVEMVAMAEWPLMSNNAWNGMIAIDGVQSTETLSFFLGVSPGWLETMKIPLLAGRDFNETDRYPGAAIVNQRFVQEYFHGENPIGRTFERPGRNRTLERYQIVGVAADARYRGMRDAIPPVAYMPAASVDEKGMLAPRGGGTFIVRTTGVDPLTLAPQLRREVTLARPEFRVSTIDTQQALNDVFTVRERLLAMLAMFFGAVALVLAGVGLYGVLDYSVLQRRREIGIRLALGARATDIARRVTLRIFSMVLTGAAAGLALGLIGERYVEPLFFGVKASDPSMLVLPWATILSAALLASIIPVIRALRINPVRMLRAD
jgi:putative ABC transport system permease protein